MDSNLSSISLASNNELNKFGHLDSNLSIH